ncbi:MAG: hypothetical protein V4437_00445 [Patescibacteria group bacterium]
MAIEKGVTPSHSGQMFQGVEVPKIPGFNSPFEASRDGLPAGLLGFLALLIIAMRPRKHD